MKETNVVREGCLQELEASSWALELDGDRIGGEGMELQVHTSGVLGRELGLSGLRQQGRYMVPSSRDMLMKKVEMGEVDGEEGWGHGK